MAKEYLGEFEEIEGDLIQKFNRDLSAGHAKSSDDE